MTEVVVTEPPARSGRARAAWAIAALMTLVAVVLAVLLVTDDSDGLAEHRQVRRVAGQFGEALLTYEYADLDANRRQVLALATGGFEESYADTFEQGLAAFIRERKANSRGTVTDVFLSEVDEGTAEAMVVADVDIVTSAGTRTFNDVYFKLELVEVGGTWKVDDVVILNFTLSGDGGLPAGSTTTSAPASTSTTAAS